MGTLFSSLFGTYQAPSITTYTTEPLPSRTTIEPESNAIRNEEQRKIRARRLMSGTILTSPLGTATNSNTASNGMLGRS